MITSDAELRRIAEENDRHFAMLDKDPKVHTEHLRSLIESSDIFFGILPDGGTWIVKGEAMLERIASGLLGTTPTVAIGALHVREAEEAEAMRIVFGDEASNPKHTSKRRLQVIKPRGST